MKERESDDLRPSYAVAVGVHGACVHLRWDGKQHTKTAWAAMEDSGVIRSFRSALQEYLPLRAAELNPGGMGQRKVETSMHSHTVSLWQSEVMACALSECRISSVRAAGFLSREVVSGES